MKKFSILCLLIVSLSTALFADLAGKWSFSVHAGGGYIDTEFGNVALSFVVPPLPVFWEVDFRFRTVLYTDVNCDYQIFDKVLAPDFFNGTVKLYICVGGHTGLGLASNTTYFSLAGRIITGLSWQLRILGSNTFEIFARLVPSLGFQMTPLVDVYAGIGVGAGIRLWIN